MSNEYAEKWERKNFRPGLTFHDFRRTAARNLIRSGVTENVAMKITGYKTRAIFDRYDIVTSDDMKIADELHAQRINGYKNGYNSEKSKNSLAILTTNLTVINSNSSMEKSCNDKGFSLTHSDIKVKRSVG